MNVIHCTASLQVNVTYLILSGHLQCSIITASNLFHGEATNSQCIVYYDYGTEEASGLDCIAWAII